MVVVQLVTFPDIRQPYHVCTETMPPELEAKVQQIFIDIDQDARVNMGRILHFEEKAQWLFDEWQIPMENDCRSGRHPSYWESHLGKQPKLLASLCIVLHRLLEACRGHRADAIAATTLQGAMALRHYYQEHAMRCYDSIQSEEVLDAHKILELIQKKRLQMRFKSQDIYHNGLGGLKESQRVSAALKLLLNSNWVALEKIQGHTGKPGEFWVVHPSVFKMTL